MMPAVGPKPVVLKPNGKISVDTLKRMAKGLAMKGVSRLAKEDLIHAIQVAEGNAACFRRIADCGQSDCLFRAECLPVN